MDATSAALIGVGIGAFVSVCAIVANIFSTNRTMRHISAREFGKISLEIKISQLVRQLNELYGPLLLLQEQEKRLASRLREGKADPEKWRLIDNLPGLLENRSDKAVIEEIMRINTKIEELLITKAGLIRAPRPPDSFKLFMGHFSVLKLAMEGKERPKVAEFEYYPRQFDQDVREAYDAILQERDELLQKYEPLLTK